MAGAHIDEFRDMSFPCGHEEIQCAERIGGERVEDLSTSFRDDCYRGEVKSNINPFQSLHKALVILNIANNSLDSGTISSKVLT